MSRGLKIVVGIVALVVVVIAGVYVAGNFIIPNSIRSSYQGKNCEQVLSLDSFYVSVYPAFMADKSTTELAKECALYVIAVETEQKKAWQDAYNAFNIYKQTYPKGSFLKEADEHSVQILMSWAKEQLAAKKYTDALANLQLVLKNYAETSAATEATDLIADVYIASAKDQREVSDFSGAESTLKKFSAWATDIKKTETVKVAQRELAQTYLAWGKAFQTEKKFDDARAKLELAISTDPEPLAKDGPAAQAKAAKVEMYLAWGDMLLAKNDFGGALDRYQTVVASVDEKDQPAAKDHIAEVYIKWAAQLSSTEDFNGALSKIEDATKNSVTETKKKAVETAKTNTYLAFSKSSGSQATQAINNALKEVCEKNKQPTLPIFGLDKEHIHAGIYGVDATLPDNVRAKTPGSLHYASCVEMTTATLEMKRFLWAYFAREQYTWNVTLRPLTDPKAVTKTSIVGSIPPALPEITYSNYLDYLFGGTFYRSRGTNPDPAVLANWLLTVMK